MALLHHARLTPTKQELVAGWLPSQPFFPFDGAEEEVKRVASFRFDDPQGQVGIETLIFQVGGTALQVPLTYRGAPLEGAEVSLLGTMEHSVLGTRWVYDAVGDPVYVAELTRTVVLGGTEVELHYEENGEQVAIPRDAHVRGSGHPDARVPATPTAPAELAVTSDASTTTVSAGDVLVRLVRDLGVPEAARPQDGDGLLIGKWEGTADALLAIVRG